MNPLQGFWDVNTSFLTKVNPLRGFLDINIINSRWESNPVGIFCILVACVLTKK